jgi:hypothetical protein
LGRGGLRNCNRNGKTKIKKTGEGDPDWDSTEYNTILVKEADNFLENHDTKDPFFIYVGLRQVHLPHSPTNYYLHGASVAGVFGSPHLDLLYEMDLVVESMKSSKVMRFSKAGMSLD